MSQEFNNPSPDEHPDDSFLEALSKNLNRLDDTPVDELFQKLDTDKLAQIEAELDALGPEAFAGWEDDDEPQVVNKEDIWDFQEKFDDPTREYNETARDMSLRSFKNAKSYHFKYNSSYIQTGIVGERRLDFSYTISDDSEFRTRMIEKPDGDEIPIISITHRESGVDKESSTYILDKDMGLIRRYDKPFDPESEELRSRLMNFRNGKEDFSEEELKDTVDGILDGFYHGLEVQDDEQKLGVNGRPVEWSEIVHLSRIIGESTPFWYRPGN
jgi:hypothetical protein